MKYTRKANNTNYMFHICDFIVHHYTLGNIKILSMEKTVQEQEQIKKMPNKRVAKIKALPKEEQEKIE